VRLDAPQQPFDGSRLALKHEGPGPIYEARMRIRRSNVVGASGAVHGERGFAVPTVMFMLLAAFAIVTVGVVASIQAQGGTVRDERSKSALTAAEAGISQALLAYNGGFTPSKDAQGQDIPTCYMPVSNPPNTVQPRSPQSGGWCQPVTGSNGAGTFSYQVCPTGPPGPSTCAQAGTLQVVSLGNVNGVTRRVDVLAKSSSGQQVFLDAGLKSQTNILLDSNAMVQSPSSAGGSILMGSTSTALCGISTVGPDGTLTGSGGYYANPNCTNPLDLSTIGHQSLTLPPVNQGDAATNNDNIRITNAKSTSNPQPTPADLISGNKNDITWNAGTRQLSLTGQKTSLTLTGRTYSLCKLTMQQNSTLYVAPNQSGVRIFFDSPEHCGLPAYNTSSPTLQKQTAQMWLESNTRITASGDPAALNIAIYFVGSPTIPTGIMMSSNSDQNAACVQNFVLYAPLTQVEMNSNSTYCGVIAGLSVHMDQNATFVTDDISRTVVLPGSAPHYAVSKFVDCSAAPASPPNAGC
jgi:hypothetical protein